MWCKDAERHTRPEKATREWPVSKSWWAFKGTNYRGGASADCGSAETAVEALAPGTQIADCGIVRFSQ